MSFVGAINAGLRSVIADLAPRWRGRPVYIACSGNFTVERTLASVGVDELHGCDISLYSCAVGAYLTDKPIDVWIKDDEYRWLEPFMDPGLPAIATLLMCSDALQYAVRNAPFHRRMWAAYRDDWPRLHEETMAKVAKALTGVRLASFAAEDAVTWSERIPDDAVCVTFPPTYSGGYERLYKLIDRVFGWNAPMYDVFTEERFNLLQERITSRPDWLIARDRPEEALAPYQIGHIQLSELRYKPFWIYAGSSDKRAVITPHMTLQDVKLKRLRGPLEPGAKVDIVTLTQAQINTLRSQYMASHIIPGTAACHMGVTVSGQLAGCLSFNRPKMGDQDIVMQTDLAISPTKVPRLSKLIAAVALTREVQLMLQMSFNRPVVQIWTTAFTERASSMKYRGVFNLANRTRQKDGTARVNYIGDAGRWTLQEAYEWWTKH